MRPGKSAPALAPVVLLPAGPQEGRAAGGVRPLVRLHACLAAYLALVHACRRVCACMRARVCMHAGVRVCVYSTCRAAGREQDAPERCALARALRPRRRLLPAGAGTASSWRPPTRSWPSALPRRVAGLAGRLAGWLAGWLARPARPSGAAPELRQLTIKQGIAGCSQRVGGGGLGAKEVQTEHVDHAWRELAVPPSALIPVPGRLPAAADRLCGDRQDGRHRERAPRHPGPGRLQPPRPPPPPPPGRAAPVTSRRLTLFLGSCAVTQGPTGVPAPARWPPTGRLAQRLPARPCPRRALQGFPTLLFFPAEAGAKPIPYDSGARSLSDLTKFIKTHAKVGGAPHSLLEKKYVSLLLN